MVLPLLECGLLNGALVVAFRGSDISQFLKQRGERIYDGLLRRGDYFFTNCRYFQCRLMALGCDPQRLEALYSGIDFNKFRFSRRQRRSDRPEQLSRGETGLAEFHCMLVRTDLFAKLGRLDEAFLNTKEHVDFSMAARQSGERIFFEPASVVTYRFSEN
jgi:GT2 family glycosyltransferase